ncbi:LrgB family protein [Pseudalkalibacillus decolorationis]|uniref:LrgB family protein n=1 Tax=Pseudalkalibacillus decolorationis TaxID=163879 RepID=UPI0021497AC6|nr:LrgB family protein [Pseudalkalibacillus decolorationis]
MTNTVLTMLASVGTILIYIGARYGYRRVTYPFMMPILTTTLVIIIILIAFGMPYQRYMDGAQWIDELLGPAVVALAFPLYQQRAMIKCYSLPLLIGIFVGVCVGIMTGFGFAWLLGVPESIRTSLLPKSVTTPVAMEIAQVSGGTPAIAVVFVMVAGIGGVILAPYLFKWVKIRSDLGKGISLGAGSHAIGTAKSLEYGERAAAVSSVAMTLSALFASVLVPLFVYFTS